MYDFTGVDRVIKLLLILAIISIITTPLAFWKLIEIILPLLG
jgi:hypothetical protein